ncbi:MAG: hypothetical protein JW999_00855 [Methanotrichaceae archaeon]|nr:hypothetical protein [Methanotrichaceae archaeon]
MMFVTDPSEEFEIVADREGIRSEIASGMSIGWFKSGQTGIVLHDFLNQQSGRI